jgi:hypothetical protein
VKRYGAWRSARRPGKKGTDLGFGIWDWGFGERVESKYDGPERENSISRISPLH